MRLATVLVTPSEARGVLGGHIHGWLYEYSIPTHGEPPFWLTVAEQGGVVVGAHAFDVAGCRLYSFSTYVLRRARGGLGSRLWAQSLAFTQVLEVAVTLASPEGARLIRRVQAEHPEVTFRVSRS